MPGQLKAVNPKISQNHEVGTPERDVLQDTKEDPKAANATSAKWEWEAISQRVKTLGFQSKSLWAMQINKLQ